jgi:hypothetical protein
MGLGLVINNVLLMLQDNVRLLKENVRGRLRLQKNAESNRR